MANVNFQYPDPSKVLGLSTSHYTGAVDWQKAKANGIEFAIMKAANGTNMNIRWWKENYRGAKDAGILVGAYTWLYPSVLYSAGRQARLFAELLKDYPTDIPATVDFEWTFPKNPNSGDLWGFVDPFEDAYGSKPMIYTAPGYWSQYGSRNEVWATYPLWQAQYNSGEYDVIKPWDGYDFLQWTQTGKGEDYGVPKNGEIACELNYWRGTREELRQFCGLDANPNELPETFTVSVGIDGQTEYVQSAVSAVIVDAFGVTWSFPR